MCLASLLFAAFLRSVTGRSTVLKLEQERLPFLANGSTAQVTISSPIGELKHLQTIEFRAPDLGGPIGLNSIIVARDGSELLAVTDINGGSFVTFGLKATDGDRYNISEAEAYPNIIDPDEEDEIVGSTLNRLRGFRGDLLALCRDPSSDSSIPRVNLQAAVHSGGVYDGHNFRVFHVELSNRRDLGRFNVGYQTGLAVREDRRSGRIFVYSMSNDFFLANFREDEQPALLTTFEWIPK
ncbi:hypothetical protein FOZ60_001243 [Perkinsus olseni]|uniref:Uncharacterized protein n=1 Tax=Perkinsus olseni TaxID=32597 RepID=A0A7J6P0T1_PEROL|nr:hypothetical protein FOZ60_001243 [Perkinsus olseni]